MLQGDLVQVKVDQVILTRAPARAMAEAQALGIKKTPVEVAVAYDGTCVTDFATCAARAAGHHNTVPPEALLHGVLVARPGVGFPAPLHLERFASPARLAVTDDPRLSYVGGIGMLSLVVSPGQLGHALAHGTITLRPPRSLQVLLSGRLRPFVCARDVSLELLRRGIADAVRDIDNRYGASVVIEFAGPSARLLSVPDRAVLCAIAASVGAASALFVSDEKSETFLRDQRRSKAHRALAPDAGAPCDDVLSIDLATVDPLLMDLKGEIKPVRDMAGHPVHQVVLGGDSGVTLRDMLAAAALLKSKRVPSRLDLLVAPPSRQVLEVLANTGALVDLVATGARLIEPDQRLITGEIYTPAKGQTSVRTFDPEPCLGHDQPFVVASAETLAFTVANGQIGDPRSFKRPVRVTVPRVFPTEDVLIIRPRKSNMTNINKVMKVAPVELFGWRGAITLRLSPTLPKLPIERDAALGVLVQSLDDARRLASSANDLAGAVRAMIGVHIPAGIAEQVNGLGIGPFKISEADLAKLQKVTQIVLPEPAAWPVDRPFEVETSEGRVELRWLGTRPEKSWLQNGVARPDVATIRIGTR